jgi:hypothetical protein
MSQIGSPMGGPTRVSWVRAIISTTIYIITFPFEVWWLRLGHQLLGSTVLRLVFLFRCILRRLAGWPCLAG